MPAGPLARSRSSTASSPASATSSCSCRRSRCCSCSSACSRTSAIWRAWRSSSIALMGRVGLHGKSFVPMLSGFSCAVPAVMATRTLENRTDRLLTMMVLPLISCSARLPIYVLVIATVFSPSARVVRHRQRRRGGAVRDVLPVGHGGADARRRSCGAPIFRGPRPTLMLELPPYRRPVLRVLLRNTWQQVRSFLVDAGTVILALTIVLWALLSYPKSDTAAAARSPPNARAIEASPAGEARDRRAGDARGPGARRAAAAQRRRPRRARASNRSSRRSGSTGGSASASSARSPRARCSCRRWASCSTSTTPTSRTSRCATRCGRRTRADGSPLMTPLTGVSLMVFFVLACQCMSTLAVVRRESGSWKWPLFMFAYQTALAYTAAFVVFQAGRALGFRLRRANGLAELPASWRSSRAPFISSRSGCSRGAAGARARRRSCRSPPSRSDRITTAIERDRAGRGAERLGHHGSVPASVITCRRGRDARSGASARALDRVTPHP